MLELRTNISAVARALADRVRRITADSVTREAAVTALAVSKRRIFDEGRNSSGAGIGTYSPSYLRIRAKRGFSGGRVILTLTDQLRVDYTLVAIANGYGLGFTGGAAGTNSSNATSSDKARYAEDRYGSIFALTNDELQLVQRIVQNRVNKILNGQA